MRELNIWTFVILEITNPFQEREKVISFQLNLIEPFIS